MNRIRTILALFLLISLSTFCEANDDQTIDVSILQLIVNGDEYDNKHVRVVGVLSRAFESDYLFLNKESRKMFISANGIGINFGVKNATKYDRFDSKYVVIQGIFKAKSNNTDNNPNGYFSKIINVGRFE